MKMNKPNVCYLHKQDDNKWEWFLADQYGRKLVGPNEKFESYQLAQIDANKNKDEYAKNLTFSE